MNNVLWLSQLNWHVRKIRFPRNREARPKSWINMSDSSYLPRLASCVFGRTDQVRTVLRSTLVIHRVSLTLLIYDLRTSNSKLSGSIWAIKNLVLLLNRKFFIIENNYFIISILHLIDHGIFNCLNIIIAAIIFS